MIFSSGFFLIFWVLLLKLLILEFFDFFFVLQIQGMHSNVATLRKASIWNEASRIVNEEGVRAFWKGNLVTIAHRLPYSSVNFYSYEHYKKVRLLFTLKEYVSLSSLEICIYGLHLLVFFLYMCSG